MAINKLDVLAEALGGEPDRFEVRDLKSLEWALRKWARVDEVSTQKVEYAREQIAQLQAYIDQTLEQAEQEKAKFEWMMRPYIEAQLAGGNTKTFNVPLGDIQLRTQPPELVRDDQQLLEFLKADNQTAYIETVEKPMWGELKKILEPYKTDEGEIWYITPEGQKVEGVKGLPRPDKLVVKLKGADDK